MARTRSAYWALIEGLALNAAQQRRLDKDAWYYRRKSDTAQADVAGQIILKARETHGKLNRALRRVGTCRKGPHSLRNASCSALQAGLITDEQMRKLSCLNREAGRLKHRPERQPRNPGKLEIDDEILFEGGPGSDVKGQGIGSDSGDEWSIATSSCEPSAVSDVANDQACDHADIAALPVRRLRACASEFKPDSCVRLLLRENSLLKQQIEVPTSCCTWASGSATNDGLYGVESFGPLCATPPIKSDSCGAGPVAPDKYMHGVQTTGSDGSTHVREPEACVPKAKTGSDSEYVSEWTSAFASEEPTNFEIDKQAFHLSAHSASKAGSKGTQPNDVLDEEISAPKVNCEAIDAEWGFAPTEKCAEFIKARILSAIAIHDISKLCYIFHRLTSHAAAIHDRMRESSATSHFGCVEGLATECKWYDEENLVQASRRFLAAIDKRRNQRNR